jgi:hypothetical protein
MISFKKFKDKLLLNIKRNKFQLIKKTKKNRIRIYFSTIFLLSNIFYFSFKNKYHGEEVFIKILNFRKSLKRKGFYFILK